MEQLLQEIYNTEGTGLADYARAAKDGLFLEFGVATGGTIKLIASVTKNKVYGFDTFKGLPESWRYMGVGHFACDIPKDLPENVELVVGLFQDTLKDFLKEHKEPITFIHIDCDIYSATKYIFDTVKDQIASGCIICFDEIVGYAGFEEHEFKAFSEFLTDSGYTWKCLGRYENEKAAFEILK